MLSSVFSTDYLAPPGGVGSEVLAINARSLGMGGISVGLPNSSDFTMLNPAASAWATEGGVAFTGRYTESDDPAWDNRLGFPMISAFLPLPYGIVVTGALEGRSRIETSLEGIDVPGGYTGDYTWSGGLVEAYLGASVRTGDWLAVSLGGRSTFGNIMSDVELTSNDSVPPVPVNSVYRDDADFRMAWGATLGLLLHTGRFGLGFSVSTDRKGRLEVDRDFSFSDEADTLDASFYTIPGEISAGVSFRPLPELLVGADLFTRKTMSILGSRTEEGSVYSVGAEYGTGDGLRPRLGYSWMDGLWMDGARTMTAGLGYSFDDRTAGLDLAAAHTRWDDPLDGELSETVFSVSLWASERWLGQ
ncbi:MAG: hypothetical protein AVO35_03400 [Candidatus Aegiribacteria sp. MLS_C]|nr:MAG: hypothetical protein AVO35_03400 [Candidatus Aegiribacteria sp. MLS_C]